MGSRAGVLPRNRWLRALVLLAFALVTLEVLYVVVGDIALAVVAKRFADDEPVGITFDRGWTWFPGRVRLRGARVHGPASGGWSVAISDADVTLSLLRRRIDSVTADVTSIDIGARRSNGAIELVVRDIAIDGSRVSLHADAKVDGATLESDKTVLAKDLHGSIALTIAPVDVEHGSLLDTASGNLSLDGVFSSLEPLASFASLATTQDPGTLGVRASLDHGALGPASEIRAHTAHATLTDAHGASADFPRGLQVVLRVAPHAPSELELAVETPSLVFAGADHGAAPDVFDDFELTVPAGSSDLSRDRLEMRSLAWSTRHATLHEGATTLAAAADGDLHFELGHATELVADRGAIHATNVTVENPDVPDRAPFDASLGITRLTVSRTEGIALHGPLHATGSDPRPLLEVLVTSPSIRGALGALAHQSFTLDATLKRGSGHLALDDLALRAARLTVRGGYRRDDAKSSGAFVLEGGPLPVGIALHDKKESIVLGASPAWLAHALATE